MKGWIALLLLTLVLTSGAASAHRMFAGQRINVETYAIFDDGSPANNASVTVFRLNSTTGLFELFGEDRADSSGKYSLSLPGKGTGSWLFEISAGGHKEELFVTISDERSDAPKAEVAALAALPLAFIAWRRRNKG